MPLHQHFVAGQPTAKEREEVSLGLDLSRSFLEEQEQSGDSLKHGMWAPGGELPQLCPQDHFPLATGPTSFAQ